MQLFRVGKEAVEAAKEEDFKDSSLDSMSESFQQHVLGLCFCKHVQFSSMIILCRKMNLQLNN
jgi:hypothetical protein